MENKEGLNRCFKGIPDSSGLPTHTVATNTDRMKTTKPIVRAYLPHSPAVDELPNQSNVVPIIHPLPSEKWDYLHTFNILTYYKSISFSK